MRNTFINTILAASEERDDIFIISGDAGLGVFDEFKEKFPERFLNLGVAEQNAASFSAGMAQVGYKVYLYNMVPFVLYRCYEQVRNDICYQRLPVVLAGIGSGLTYAPQGMTHYSVEDLGIAQTLPNLTVLSPIDPIEAKLAALYSLEADTPVYVRLAKKREPRIHKSENLDITSPQQIEEGEGIAILFHGSISLEVLKASEILKKEKIFPKLISIPMIQPLNAEKLFVMLKSVDYVLSVEEHFINTGLGSILLKEYTKRSPAWKLFLLGIPDKFIHEIKDLRGMREHFGISGTRIADFIKDIKDIIPEQKLDINKSLVEKANYIRSEVIRVAVSRGAGHIAPSLSCVDILVALYYDCMSHNPKFPLWEDRDRLIFSKAHGCYALYAILADKGIIPKKEWETFYTEGSTLSGCTERKVEYALEAGCGSLGHGLPIAVGLAFGAQLQKKQYHTFCIVGDGELQEGSMWEAIQFAVKHGLGNLTIIIDRNRLQAMDFIEKILDREKDAMIKRLQGFGLSPVVCSGHDAIKLAGCIRKVKASFTKEPKLIIAETIKGFGLKCMENVPKFHFRIPSEEELSEGKTYE